MKVKGSQISRIVGARAFLVGVLVVAAALRTWHVLALRNLPLFERLILDSEVYDAWAQHIAAGDWLSEILAAPFYMDPLYPYVLAFVYRIVGRDLLVVRLMQVALGVATCGLVAVLGRRLRNAVAGNLGALLVAFYTPAIFQEGEFEKTALGVFLATSALVLFLTKSAWARFAAGAALGLAVLTRGNVLLLAPFAAAYLLVNRDWRSAVSFALGVAMAIAPVSARNHYVSGEWVLTGSGLGQNFYTGNNATNRDGAYHAVPFARPQSAHEEGDFRHEAERRTGRVLTASETSTFWLHEALRHMARAPGFATSVFLSKLGLFWSDVELADAWDMNFIRQFSLPLRLPHVPFSLLAALALFGVFPAARTPNGRIVIGFVILYCASVVAFFIFSRYRLHAVPALAALAGTGIAWAGESVSQRQIRALAVPASLAVALGGFSALSFQSLRRETLTNYASLAEIYQERGEFDTARRLLLDGLQRAPKDPSILCALGKLSLRTGAAAAGVEYVSGCLRSNPFFPDGWYWLGMLLEMSGDKERARAAYRQQLQVIPGHERSLERLQQL